MNRVVLFAAAAMLLAGCGESGRIFGFERGGPDEFTVVRNPPLSVPPQATLRPPERDTDKTSRDLSSKQARASLVATGDGSAGSAGTLVTEQGSTPYDGGTLASRGSSPSGTQQQTMAGGAATQGTAGIPAIYGAQSGPSVGEAALARRAVAYYGIEPDIRRKVDSESAQLAIEQEKFLHKVLFWKETGGHGTGRQRRVPQAA
jgi:hypothetical protein